MNIDIELLKPGDVVAIVGGGVGKVLKESQDGQWILIEYLESPENADLIGTEDLCSEDELEAIVSSS